MTSPLATRFLGGVRCLAVVLALTCPAYAFPQVVDNARPLRSGAQAWRIDPKPILDIGSTDGDSVYEFLRITGIARLSDGRIAVANSGTSTIRFFDSTGKYLSATGRRGEGPGEFRQILGLRVFTGDTLHVTHIGGVDFFSSTGRYIRRGHSRGEPVPGRPLYIWPGAVLPDGSHIGVDNLALNQRSTRTGRWIDSTTMYRVFADGKKIDSIGRFPYVEQAFMASVRGAYRVEFSPWFTFAAGGNSIYAAFPDRNEIGVYSLNGQRQRTIRWSVPRTSVTSTLVNDYKQKFLSQPGEDGRPAPPSLKAHWERMMSDQVFADQLPAFQTVHVDRTNNLWVQRYDVWIAMPGAFGPSNIRTNPNPTSWDVFDAQGRWVTSVALPANFTPTGFGANDVTGVWRDVDDVEHVRAYRIIKP